MSISANLTAHFHVANEQPAAALAHWRANRPDWLPAHYQEVSDSYNSVSWEWSYKQLSMKFIPFSGFFGGRTVYRLTALFESDGAFGSSITVNGGADEKTQNAIKAAAESFQAGGLV